MSEKKTGLTSRMNPAERMEQELRLGRYPAECLAFVTVPNCVVGHFAYKLLWSANPENHKCLGLEEIPTIVGTITAFCWH